MYYNNFTSKTSSRGNYEARTRSRVIGVSVGCLLPRAHACARGRAFVWLAFVFVVLSSMSSGT